MTRNPPGLSDEGSARNRYPGMRPFSDSAEDRACFFGRTEEGEQLYLRVLSVQLLVQFGRSGLGKTSLLQAALFPRLREKPFLPVMVRLNVLNDTLTLAAAGSIQQSCKAEGVQFTEGRMDGLWELLSTTMMWRDDLLLTPVLVFDQFEEVFTLRDATFRADLAAELGALVSGIVPERLRAGGSEEFAGRPDVKIVISLREDYLGALQEFSAAIPSLFHERLRLEPLTEDAARQAIIGPAQLVAGPGEEPYRVPPFDLEPLMLDSIIAYLKGSSGVIEPFQLQLLCRHAERIAGSKTQDDSIKLTPADFSGNQDFPSVLKNFYRDTLLKLPSRQRKKAQELCEDGLLDSFGHRLPLEEGQIRREFGITADTLSTLSRERLVTCERRLESVFYEISHDRLAESVFATRRRKLPKKIRRRILTAALTVPVVIAIMGSGLFFINEARKQAESERKHAERLLSFLMGEDFLGEVNDLGRSTMIAKLVDESSEYLKDNVAWRSSTALVFGLVKRNAANVEETQGHVETSVKFLDQAFKFLESSRNPTSLRESARTHELMGGALSYQGQVAIGLSHYEAAVNAWRQVARDAAAAKADCISLANSLTLAGWQRYIMGEATLSLTGLDEALEIITTLIFGHQPDQCGPLASEAQLYPDAKALGVLSEAMLTRAQILDSTMDYNAAEAFAMEARRLRPPSASARKNALAALAWRGNARKDQPQRALHDYRNTLAGFEELRQWDPSNRSWQRERAATQLVISEGILACHKSKTEDCKPMPWLEDAEATTLEAIATLRALAGIDPTNLSLQRDLGWALHDYAILLDFLDRKDERLAMLEESEKFFISSMNDPADAEGAEKLGFLLLDKFDALAALDRQTEAKAILQRSIDLFSGLIAAHQDNPFYVFDLKVARQHETDIHRKAGDRTGTDAADREVKRLDAQYQKSIESRVRNNQKAHEQHQLTSSYMEEGYALFNKGAYAAALDKFKAAESSGWEYIRLQRGDFSGYDWLSYIYRGIQLAQRETDNAKEGIAAAIASMRAAQIAVLLAPEDEEEINKMLRAQHNFGVSLYDNGRFDDGLAVVQEEVVIDETLLQRSSQGEHLAEHTWRLGDAEFGLGKMRRERKKAGWEEALRSALIHLRKSAEIDTKKPAYEKEVGSCRKYLAEQLDRDSRKEEASVEYRLALKNYEKALEAYQKAASISPDDKKRMDEVEDEIRTLRAKQQGER